ncbi:DNA polymerase delta catalytic subunit, partial [Bonamia ostreae]
GNVNQLLFGEHTRNIKISNSSNSSLMKFFSKSKKCRGCRNVLAKDEKAICRYCQPNIDKILLKETKNLRSRERRFSELWVQCQRCQDTVAQEILCSNRDCPIFYRRTKA